jgi:asparagine synthase (glutamine-hydrolysing)
MCGISGGIGFTTWDDTEILSCIAHRGPDSKGSFSENRVYLGHTRLAIQDLSENGNQPMFSDEKRFVIIFNGEIYNHLDIRRELQKEFNFKSSSDTETVLYAYIKHGPSFVNLLNGIFALAIYDRQLKELFIARDQIGVKPLYIYQDEKCFLFSSEIKTFLSFPINKDLDPQAFANYLTFLWSPGKCKPFKHVTKLLPGHYMHFSVEDFRNAIPQKYYQIPFTGKYLSLPEDKLIDLLEKKLSDAVKRQMLSDVAVGFFLSGGLDSSLIVAIAKKIYPGIKFPCYTIDVGSWGENLDGFTDDLSYARKVATYLDVDLHVVKADIDIVKDFDKMIWHLDEPQADAAPLNLLNIAALARSNGIKVLLGGTGGDDLFSGYRRHQALMYEKYFRFIPRFAGRMINKMASMLPLKRVRLRRLGKLTHNLNKSVEERMAGYFSWLPEEVVTSLFTKKWKEVLENYTPLTYLTDLNKEIPQEKSLLNQILYWEMKTFLVDHNLNYTDKMGMAIGVEARVPFLDMDLIEFAATLPPDVKLKGNETKYILKKVAERYLPKDVIYRPKTGFGAPVRKWITSDLQPMIDERLSIDRIKARGIFNPVAVWDLINQNKSGKIDASYSIWALLAIESWCMQFVDGIELYKVKNIVK